MLFSLLYVSPEAQLSRLLPLDTLVRKLYIHLQKNIGYIWFKNKLRENFGCTSKDHISVKVIFIDAHKQKTKIVHDCVCKVI